jgi:hypothetical protein
VLPLLLCFALKAAAASAQVAPLREPGTDVSVAPPPKVGACIGGSCTAQRPPTAAPDRPARAPNRRARFALAGAVLGAASAGLLLGGAIAIAVADDGTSERVTRPLWLGQLAVSTPLVALSSWMARRAGGGAGYRSLRRLGWTAYGAGVADGIILWYGAREEWQLPAGLTVVAGAIACFALLPHALDALIASRAVRSRGARSIRARAGGLALTF